MTYYLVIPANTPPFITDDEELVKREIKGGDLSEYYKIVPRPGQKPRLRKVSVKTVKEMREVNVDTLAYD